jgi:hypothetical protein
MRLVVGRLALQRLSGSALGAPARIATHL